MTLFNSKTSRTLSALTALALPACHVDSDHLRSEAMESPFKDVSEQILVFKTAQGSEDAQIAIQETPTLERVAISRQSGAELAVDLYEGIWKEVSNFSEAKRVDFHEQLSEALETLREKGVDEKLIDRMEKLQKEVKESLLSTKMTA